MKCVSSGQFVTHFVLRVVESKHTCQQLQGRTNKHGRRALFVLFFSVFRLPVAESFYNARWYIIADNLRQQGGVSVSFAEDDDDLWANLTTANGKGGIFRLRFIAFAQGCSHSDVVASFKIEPVCSCQSCR